KIENTKPITLDIGNFDGLHIGHQNLIEKTKLFSDTQSAVMTFYPHPMGVITNKSLPILMDIKDKERALKQTEVDHFFVVEFTKSFSKLEKDQFIGWLKQLNVLRIVVGRDFKFGHKGSGSVANLQEHFEVIVVDDLLYKNTRVSTTYIKLLLEQGDMKLAKKLLNKSYSIHGEVIHGDKVGKMIGYPTANIDYKNHYLPKIGVYAVKVQIGDHTYLGCANLGHNPTLNYSTTKRLEVFIMDYDANLYEEEITVSFEHYLRDEIKYDKVEDMIEQIKKDVEQTYNLLKK
ncbi:MAG: bifunctional riboflavin kinase/FAD synthetase, partial [Acholeplasma sp.]